MLIVEKVKDSIFKPVHIAPLVVFRIIFGLMMAAGVIRFALNGWIEDLYIKPEFFFTFPYFEWVKPFPAFFMYLLFALMGAVALSMALGLYYRASAVLFFISFTYIELIDKTNYLNHYYFISIMAFLMIFLPAHRYFSIDAYRRPFIYLERVPAWTINAIKLQLGIVYFYAGLAKLNYDWLINAMPLKIWLPANSGLPLIGSLLDQQWMAYFFSWSGAIYDLFIPFLLLSARFRPFAYVAVIVFHVFTRILFPIGMFPYVMILSTLIFFSESFHLKIIDFVRNIFKIKKVNIIPVSKALIGNKIILALFCLHFIIQILLPFRHVFFPGNLYWTEEGYRFSWRVMLMEKAGTAFFYVKDPKSGGTDEISNCDYLTPNQEKMMSTQPDMILQYAHFLKKEYEQKGINNPIITVESYATLNGSGSRLFIDPNVNLSEIKDNQFSTRNWVLPFKR
ncbi:MAG: HTTM domain-containing protein [Bacteroidota bacterium]|nr:HTTM domain-containing protein [Bacteroidota bacterium]